MTTIVNPLPIPKPKRFAPREKNPFFPLTFSCAASASASAGAPVVWNHFTGYLVGRWVAVFHRGDAETLARANFGKGALSKFGLFFDGRDRKLVPPAGLSSFRLRDGDAERGMILRFIRHEDRTEPG